MPGHEQSNTTAPALAHGQVLGGRYQIDDCLGAGGMASVYRATHLGLDQPVAVKVIAPVFREVAGVVARFVREARAATKLKGEHVVRVFDVGTTDDGTPFLVMELLEGQDLSEILEDPAFEPDVDDAIDFALQACEALAEVHGLGIVHRDLKPANLFVTRGPDGSPFLKLIDFGISRIDSPLSPKDSFTVTSPDLVMGSPKYMPPEQMESARAADFRSDIWGLGAILYEIFTGHAPFDGESLLDIYSAAVRCPPPSPTETNGAIPQGLSDVVLRCLKPEMSDRYADVAELAVALAAFGDERAAARADAVGRTLDATRVRGTGAPTVTSARMDRTPSSRSRSRSEHRSRRGMTVFAVAAIAFAGLGFGARPLLDRFHPTVSVTAAEAATEPPRMAIDEVQPTVLSSAVFSADALPAPKAAAPIPPPTETAVPAAAAPAVTPPLARTRPPTEDPSSFTVGAPPRHPVSFASVNTEAGSSLFEDRK